MGEELHNEALASIPVHFVHMYCHHVGSCPCLFVGK